MTLLRQNITFALRGLRRRPGFAGIAITTIALGIGAATAIYSVVDGVVFRPLAFNDPGRLVAVWQTYPQWRQEPILASMWDRIPLSIPEYRDWRAAQTVFSDVAIWAERRRMTLGGADRPEMVPVTRASASLLSVLDVSPTMGRYFTEQEDVLGGPAVAMVTYEAWVNRYQRDPNIMGRSVRLNDLPYTIIGVLPEGLTLSRTTSASGPPAFWTPVGQEADDANQRGNHSYIGLARLKPGVTLQHAAQETDRILRGETSPDKLGVRLEDLQSDQTRTVRKPLFVLLGAVGLLLLIACINVAVLLLGEASTREQEIAARIALGAGRTRIIAQLLTESVALAVVGALAGTALAWAGTRGLVALAPSRIPGLADVGMDWRVLGFALAAALGTGILFGLAPALALARSSPSQVFRGLSGQSAGGRGRLQRVLVAVELALSLMLLVGAALLSRSLNRLTAVDPGFRTDHLLAVRVTLPTTRFTDATAVRAFFRGASERLASLPGVAGVTAISNIPFGGGTNSSSIEIEGRPIGADEQHPEAQQRTISANYFQVMGIPLLAGRSFDENDRAGAPQVVIVSRLLGRRDFPNESPLGKHVKFQGTWWQVVGVVADSKYSSLAQDDQATLYAPVEQRVWSFMSFLVRTTVEPASLTPAIRAALHEVEPGAPFDGADRMTDLITRSFAEERFRALLIALFGVVAGVLAAVGMYGVTSRAVSRRTHEMGIRVALGATAGNVTGLMVRYTLNGVAIGIALGLAGALFASRALAPFLFGVTATDRASYLTSIVVLGAVSVVATWLPARRAAHVEPAAILRGE
jgi:putative ABC transport system permease protein